jgi:predicted MFS family arabinose efflux permease
MPDYPEKAKFLSEDERKVVLRRLEFDQSSLSNDFAMKYAKDALTDWKIWVHVIITICVYTGVYSFSLFIPTIIRDLGYANSTAQPMTVPPFVVACFLCVAAGWYADKRGQRGIFMVVFILTA